GRQSLARIAGGAARDPRQPGHHLVPYPIPGITEVSIRAVLAPALADHAQIGFDVRSRSLEKRANPPAGSRAHGAQSAQAGASYQAKQEGLELIVRVVRRGDRLSARAVRGGEQELAPELPQPALAREPAAAHPLARVPARRVQPDAQPRAQIAHETDVAVGGAAAESVMEMRRRQLDPELPGDAMETEQQGG